mmetsp:Transcript_26690/g.83588  ORF Transcript_26690/g.83588 Transcript_26690/m.83588 type:complete len:385 (-) Transcript_26690:99-1253(-)
MDCWLEQSARGERRLPPWMTTTSPSSSVPLWSGMPSRTYEFGTGMFALRRRARWSAWMKLSSSRRRGSCRVKPACNIAPARSCDERSFPPFSRSSACLRPWPSLGAPVSERMRLTSSSCSSSKILYICCAALSPCRFAPAISSGTKLALSRTLDARSLVPQISMRLKSERPGSIASILSIDRRNTMMPSASSGHAVTVPLARLPCTHARSCVTSGATFSLVPKSRSAPDTTRPLLTAGNCFAREIETSPAPSVMMRCAPRGSKVSLPIASRPGMSSQMTTSAVPRGAAAKALSCSSVTRPSSRFPILTCKWVSTGSVCESMSSRRLTNLWTLGSLPKEPSRPRASSGVDQHRGPSASDEEEDSESKRGRPPPSSPSSYAPSPSP